MPTVNEGPTPPRPLVELTIRGVILGALLTVLFTAANVYLGLKLGITFATSIPAYFFLYAPMRENPGLITGTGADPTTSLVLHHCGF